MKRILLAITLISCILTGCRLHESGPIDSEGAVGPGPVVCSFGVHVPAFSRIDLRSGVEAEPEIKSLRVLVFGGSEDRGHTFLYSSPATLSSDGTYSVKLIPTSEPRILHFVANYDFTTWSDADYLDRDEGEVIPQLVGADLYLWCRSAHRHISASESLGTHTLLRSQAKLTLLDRTETKDTAPASFKIIGAATIGTVAPFDGYSTTFAEGTITTPPEVAFTSSSPYIPAGGTVFTPERHAKAEPHFYVILKKPFEGTDSYYKIDLIGQDPDKKHTLRYDLRRNYEYRITITQLKRAGYATEQEAIDGVAINSAFADHDLEVFPAIYSPDGRASLEVESTSYRAGAHTSAVNTSYRYTLDGQLQNDKVQLTIIEDDPGAPLIKELRTYASAEGEDTGTVSVLLHQLPEGMGIRTAYVRIEAGEGDHQLIRIIRITQYPLFSFEPALINGENPGTIDNATQNNLDATLSFTIPEDYPKELLPVQVSIQTNTLSPVGRLPLRIEEGGKMVYTYTANRTGQHTLPFKTTKSSTQEAVKLSAPNFADELTGYNIGHFTGLLTYTFQDSQPRPIPQDATIEDQESYKIVAGKADSQSYSYVVSIPVGVLESPTPPDDSETVPISVRIPMQGTATSPETSYRIFSKEVPLRRYWDAYRQDPQSPGAVDVTLNHTSTLIFGSINAYNNPTEKASIPQGSEIEVVINPNTPELVLARGKIWRDNVFELEYPVDEHVTAQSPVQMRVTTRRATAHSGAIIETYSFPTDPLPTLGAITRNKTVSPHRSQLSIFGKGMFDLSGVAWNIEPHGYRRTEYYPQDARGNTTASPTPGEIYPSGRYRYDLPPESVESQRFLFRYYNTSNVDFYDASKSLRELREDSYLYFVRP